MEEINVPRVVDLASRTGKILLQSGADIVRVEDTINHIMRSYGINEYDIFTVSNGVFISASDVRVKIGENERSRTRICNVPRSSTNLGKVDAINSLSRRIEAENLPLDAAEAELDRIEAMPKESALFRIIMAAVGAGALCIIFDGSFTDALCAILVTLIYYPFSVLLDTTELSKLLTNLIGGIAIGLLSVGCVRLGLAKSPDPIIIGAIMPLIPGVMFVNAVRDIASGDYITGSVRMIDAAVIAAGIAMGVGVALITVRYFGFAV